MAKVYSPYIYYKLLVCSSNKNKFKMLAFNILIHNECIQCLISLNPEEATIAQDLYQNLCLSSALPFHDYNLCGKNK